MHRKGNSQKCGFIMLVVIISNGPGEEETVRESYKIFKFQGT